MRRLLLAPFLVSALALAVAAPADANLILNGDFEDNTATGSLFNLPNTSYTTIVANSTAFGPANEIDLVTAGGLGIPPQSGNWEVELAGTGSAVDAISLVLSVPVIGGNSYSLQFFAARTGIAEIGLSSVATNQGTVIFSGAGPGFPVSPAWNQYDHTFIAPHDASFLTVAASILSTTVAVDNISLTQVPEPSTALLMGLGLFGLGAVGKRK